MVRQALFTIILLFPLLACAWTGNHTVYEDPVSYPPFIDDPAAVIKDGMARYDWTIVEQAEQSIRAKLDYEGHRIVVDISYGDGLITVKDVEHKKIGCEPGSPDCAFDSDLYSRWRLNLRRGIALEIHQLTINQAINPLWTSKDMATLRLNREVSTKVAGQVDMAAFKACNTDQQLLEGIETFDERLRFPLIKTTREQLKPGVRILDLEILAQHHQDPTTIKFGGVPVTLEISFSVKEGDKVIYSESRSCSTTAAGSASDANSFCEGYYQCALSHGKYMLKVLRRGPYQHMF